MFPSQELGNSRIHPKMSQKYVIITKLSPFFVMLKLVFQNFSASDSHCVEACILVRFCDFFIKTINDQLWERGPCINIFFFQGNNTVIYQPDNLISFKWETNTVGARVGKHGQDVNCPLVSRTIPPKPCRWWSGLKMGGTGLPKRSRGPNNIY